MADQAGLSTLTGDRFELMISCLGLADLDEFTKSDPMCVLFFKQYGQWKEIGRTEAIINSLDPKFVETFVLEFDHTVQQCLMFSVYDIDCRSMDLRHHDYVGGVEVTFGDLLDPDSDINTCCRTLRVPGSSKGRGIISITTERIHDCKDKVSLHVGAHKLNKKGRIIATKPDVYFEISRSIDTVSYHPVYRTETIYRTQHPRWRPLELDLQRLCNGDWDRPLELSVWHHSGSGDYKMIGRKVTTLRDLKNMQMSGHYKELALAPRADSKANKLKNSIKITSRGQLRFYNIRVDCDYSLLDYARGGMQLKSLVAIDFTASNGKPGEPASLHGTEDGMCSPYQEVLESLGELVFQHSTDRRIGVLGFGAKTDNDDATSHCFPLAGSWDKLYVNGIQNAIALYKKRLKRLQLSGPTRLKHVIARAESMCVKEPSQQQQHYTVLLVITDGVINDIDDVIERLISISHLPLSVIFVGVGPADFSLMECFSHHSISLLTYKHKRIKSSRRHTHFVAFPRENGRCINTETLARETFAVISTQITDYMRQRGIVPNRPVLKSVLSNGSIKRRDVTSMTSSETLTRSASRSSLSSLVSRRTIGTQGPKCPTCGSVIEHETKMTSALMTSSSFSDVTMITGVG